MNSRRRAIEHLEPDAHPLEGRRELAQLVLTRVHDRLVEGAAGDPLSGALEPPDSACVHRRQGIAGHDREQQPDQTRNQEPPLDQMQACERIRERVAEHDHRARTGRERNLRVQAPVALDRPALQLSGRGGPERDRVALDVARVRRARIALDQDDALELRVDDDPGREERRRLRREVLLPADVRLVAPRNRPGVLLELVELGVHELRLERGHHDQVHDRKHARRRRERAPARAEAGSL